MIFKLSNAFGVPVLIYSEPEGDTYVLEPERSVLVELIEADTNGDPDAPVIDLQIRRELDEMYFAAFPVGGSYRVIEGSEEDID